MEQGLDPSQMFYDKAEARFVELGTPGSGSSMTKLPPNAKLPPLDFLETREQVRPGDRVVSSGDGGMLPAGLLVGQVVLGADRRMRVRLAADYERLEFLRVLRSAPQAAIDDPGGLVPPMREPQTVALPETPADG